jgi:hypothetical protein
MIRQLLLDYANTHIMTQFRPQKVYGALRSLELPTLEELRDEFEDLAGKSGAA